MDTSIGHSPELVCVTGLPRAGSSLLCQILATHPQIYCSGRTSPACNALIGLRRILSADPAFLSQLDHSYDDAYGRLQASMTGMLRGWVGGHDKAVAIDKNRSWLHCIEMLLQIAPEAKMIVCIRELGQIYGSIEDQHQQSILLDFNDHLADFDRFGRADTLFAKDRAIGSSLISIHAIPDLPAHVRERLYILKFEDLTSRPQSVIRDLYQWLGLEQNPFDTQHLPMLTLESDSIQSVKYPHRQRAQIDPPNQHFVPNRIQKLIQNAYSWFYHAYYPNAVR